MDWQTVSALTIVGLAVGWLLRYVALACRETAPTGCSHCPSRAASDAVKSLPLVQLQSPSARPQSQPRFPR